MKVMTAYWEFKKFRSYARGQKIGYNTISESLYRISSVDKI